MAQEMPDLCSDIVRKQHPDMAVRQHDVIVQAGDHGLADRDRAVVVVVEVREELPGADAPGAGNGP
jgi:hypothetical protein